MKNYHYIIASLPDLQLDFSDRPFSYNEIESFILGQLDEKDKQLVRWLDFGSDSDNLSPHFYNKVKDSKSQFLRFYFDLDLKIRNAKVEYLTTHSLQNNGIEDYDSLGQIFSIQSVIEKEQAMDKFRWDKISEYMTFQYFSMDCILAFLAKGQIVQRWFNLNQERGAELFKELVQEVRGTFKGINFN